MLHTVEFYYFSPTGGTKKAGEAFCTALAENVKAFDLGKCEHIEVSADIIVVAAPVFAGRIPTIAAERLKKLNGKGKEAVTLAVYGVRAYDDALLEMNDIMQEDGFEVVASAALVAEHSIVREVGAGRPDAQDISEIKAFAENVSKKINDSIKTLIQVPGNKPYKPGMKVAVTPISTEACNTCGVCVSVCSTGAIVIEANHVKTDLHSCIMCMACVAHCPKKVRMLPAAMQEGMNQKLGVLKSVRRENEFYL